MRMTGLIFLISLMAAGSATADGFYLKAFGGGSFLADTDVTLGAASGPTSFDTGTILGGAVGYDYPGSPWRAELEFAYRGADASELPGAIGSEGDFASTALMVNGIYEFASRGRWQPFVGVGVGVLTEIDFDVDVSNEFNDRGSFAAQLIAGTEYALSERLALTGELRYFRAGSVGLSSGGSTLEADYSTTDLNLGLKLSF